MQPHPVHDRPGGRYLSSVPWLLQALKISLSKTAQQEPSPTPVMDPAASDWHNLTAEVLRKVVDLLQPQETAASAFPTKEAYLSSFLRVCPRWFYAACKILVPAWSTLWYVVFLVTLKFAAGLDIRHVIVHPMWGSDAILESLLRMCPAAHTLELPVRSSLTEATVSILRGLPRIRFLDVSRKPVLSITELTQLEGVTTLLAWFPDLSDKHPIWELCTICESLTTLKHISIADVHRPHVTPANWQEKMNCLTQLKLLESLASRRVPSPACLAALTMLTRLELFCFHDHRQESLSSAMDVMPSLTRSKALRLGPCPSVDHLALISGMPHLTSLDITGSKHDYCGATGSLHAVHKLCHMAIVRDLDCCLWLNWFTDRYVCVHVWSQGQAENKADLCISGTKYKITLM